MRWNRKAMAYSDDDIWKTGYCSTTWFREYVGRQPVTSRQNTPGKAIAFEKIHWNTGMQYLHTFKHR